MDFDLVIIGSGPAGISALIYFLRANITNLVVFGKKENKAQEVSETNPEDKDSSYSESFSYEGRLDPATLEFIPDEGSLPPGVPLEKA